MHASILLIRKSAAYNMLTLQEVRTQRSKRANSRQNTQGLAPMINPIQ